MTAITARLPAVSGTIITRAVVIVSGIAVSIVTARALGPEGRGQYYAAVTLAAAIAQFGNLGLSSSNTFLAAHDGSRSSALVVNGWWLAASVALLTAILLWLSGDALALRLDADTALLWLVCLLGPAMLSFVLGHSVFAANERFLALNGWQITFAVMATAALLAAAIMGAGPLGFVLASTAVATGCVIVMNAHLVHGSAFSWRFDMDLFRKGLGYAWRAYLALLASFLLQRAAVALLAVFHSAEQVGVFSIAAQIYDMMIVVPSSVGLVLFPLLVRRASSSWRTTLQALGVTLAAMLAVCTVAVLVGRQLIPWVFGSAYEDSYDVMLRLLPAVLFVSAVTILSQYIVADGFPLRLVGVWAAGLVVCIAVGIPLTRAEGALGAAIAQSSGSLVVLTGAGWLARRKNSLHARGSDQDGDDD